MDERLIFVPRDAGFLSCFNYFMGLLVKGYRPYPYYNLKSMLRLHNNNLRHFCYASVDIENCWFEFFEPVRFDEDDDVHLHITKYPHFRVSRGEQASSEFRYPLKTRQLVCSTHFAQWRRDVHDVFAKHIRLQPDVVARAARIYDTFKQNTIAVHFRHPAHSCEQGCLYFADYFKKIDQLLVAHPDSKIFLATDTELAIAAFVFKYGDRILYNKDCKRTSVDNILSWAFASHNNKPDALGFVNNVGYQIHNDSCTDKNFSTELGKDVLVDAICISECQYFIHATSNVSLFVSYLNPNINMIFLV